MSNTITIGDIGSNWQCGSGNRIIMQSTSFSISQWVMVTDPNVPSFTEAPYYLTEALASRNPVITINGWFDRTLPHASGEANKHIDYFYLKSFNECPTNKEIIIGDEVLETYPSGGWTANAGSTFITSGSSFIVQANGYTITSPARSENEVTYKLNLIVQSGAEYYGWCPKFCES